MRFARRLAGLSLLVALTGGCDSTQPLQLEEQTVEIRFLAVNSVTKTFNTWDVFEDNDGDEQPDDGMFFLWCETVPPNQNLPPVTVPWNFSVDVKVLRAGETVPEDITSAEARSATANVAAYDVSPPFTGTTPPKADLCTQAGDAVACPPGSSPPAGGSRYRFRNPRRERGANVNIMFANASPAFTKIQDDDPMNILGLGQGLCSAGNPGPSNIDDLPQPLTVDISKGDTILVKARLAESAPSMGGLTQLLEGGGIPPNSLSGTMTIGGRPITLVGTTNGEAVSFSYTSR